MTVEASEPGRVYPVLSQLAGVPVCAVDGEAGTVRTFLVDVEHWTVAQLVATVGGTLGGRAVVIGAGHLGRYDWAFAAGALRVNLTRGAIDACTPFDAEYAGPLLRADDLAAYTVGTADDDAVGLVEDVLVDDVAWAVRFVQLDVGDRSLLVPAAWIDRIDRLARTIRLVVDRAQVRASPPFSGRGSPGPNLG